MTPVWSSWWATRSSVWTWPSRMSTGTYGCQNTARYVRAHGERSFRVELRWISGIVICNNKVLNWWQYPPWQWEEVLSAIGSLIFVWILDRLPTPLSSFSSFVYLFIRSFLSLTAFSCCTTDDKYSLILCWKLISGYLTAFQPNWIFDTVEVGWFS